MRAFLNGFSAVAFACCLVQFLTASRMPPVRVIVILVISVCIVPTLAAWMAAAAVHRRRPRLALDGGKSKTALALGGMAAVVAMTSAAFLFRVLPPRYGASHVLNATRALNPDGSISLISEQSAWRAGLSLLDRLGPDFDGVILAGTAAVAAWLVLRVLGGRRLAGRCLGCGYDITASLSFGRCPECGEPLDGGPWLRALPVDKLPRPEAPAYDPQGS